MSQPHIADKKPIAVELTADEHYVWCQCGYSQRQPFCDGSHQGTEFTPLTFTVPKNTTAYLCQCKQSKNPPYCDGSHTKLTASGESTAVPGNIQPTAEEPTLKIIHDLAREGLTKTGLHGEIAAMGVPRDQLPHWDDIQILVGQFATKPLLDDTPVGTELVIGSEAKKPLQLTIPLLISDMSFGALSEPAKIALAQGAKQVGTGICSGEGGMLPSEQAANQCYLFELGSAQFGYSEEILSQVQAFHFKGGQAAKTGIGGHLPADKVTERIAQVRGLAPHTAAISPATFENLSTPRDYKKFAKQVRAITGGIPIGMKMSANHIEKDLAFALEVGVDYIILDGRGGGTGAAPLLFRDNISVPTLAALARARHYLRKHHGQKVTLIITGGLRLPADFIKALCLGADGIAIANAAMQAIGCVAARMCHTNQCPAAIATQQPELIAKFNVEQASQRLGNFLTASTELMKLMARACGHNHFNQFNKNDIITWKKEIADLTGIDYAGLSGR